MNFPEFDKILLIFLLAVLVDFFTEMCDRRNCGELQKKIIVKKPEFSVFCSNVKECFRNSISRFVKNEGTQINEVNK